MPSKSLLHRSWSWKGSLKNHYCNSLLKLGSSTADCPGLYLMRSCLPPRTETPPPLGKLFQSSTTLQLRFSLCLNGNSYITFHACCLLSSDWAKPKRCWFLLYSFPLYSYTLARPSRLNSLISLVSLQDKSLCRSPKSFNIFATLY